MRIHNTGCNSLHYKSPGTEGRSCLHEAEHPQSINHLGHKPFHVIIIHRRVQVLGRKPHLHSREILFFVFTGALQNELFCQYPANSRAERETLRAVKHQHKNLKLRYLYVNHFLLCVTCKTVLRQ
jgi:hypothetical protein